MNLKLLIGVIFYLFLSVNYTYSQVNEGSINGIVIDSETGETLIGVNVVLEGTSKGTATDIDGEYILKAIEPGTYTLIVSYISFTNQRITGVEIKAGESVQIDIILNPETEFLNEIFVTAEVVLDNEAGLLKQRQKSISFSDAISAESITRSWAGDAAGAMKKVVGASVVGGKYVYVRGLGDRYSSSHLNGVELPSADPDKKSFQFDMFPSSLLENIITIKTFTPYKPGNFSGGLVDIYTKDVPEKRTFNASFSGGYNSLASGKEGYLSTFGSANYLAKDYGTRAVPQPILDYLSNPEFELPSSNVARFYTKDAYLLDDFSSHFNNEIRDNTGGEYYNSIFSDHAGLAVTIEASGKVAGFDAKTRLAEGDLILQNNLWYGFGAGNTIAEFAGGEDQAHTRDYLSDAANANRVADPMLRGISRTAGSNGLDPRPKSGSPALDASAVKTIDNEFITATDYVGAFADNYL